MRWIVALNATSGTGVSQSSARMFTQVGLVSLRPSQNDIPRYAHRGIAAHRHQQRPGIGAAGARSGASDGGGDSRAIGARVPVVVWPRIARNGQRDFVLDADLVTAVDGQEIVARAAPPEPAVPGRRGCVAIGVPSPGCCRAPRTAARTAAAASGGRDASSSAVGSGGRPAPWPGDGSRSPVSPVSPWPGWSSAEGPRRRSRPEWETCWSCLGVC